MKTRRIEWRGRTVEIRHEEPRYFCEVLFFERDASGMGIWLVPSDKERNQIILDAGPKLSRSVAWRRTYSAEYCKGMSK